jgi:hypothetical protein
MLLPLVGAELVASSLLLLVVAAICCLNEEQYNCLLCSPVVIPMERPQKLKAKKKLFQLAATNTLCVHVFMTEPTQQLSRRSWSRMTQAHFCCCCCCCWSCRCMLVVSIIKVEAVTKKTALVEQRLWFYVSWYLALFSFILIVCLFYFTEIQ